MRRGKHIIYIEKGGQVRLFYGMTKAFLSLANGIGRGYFPFSGGSCYNTNKLFFL